MQSPASIPTLLPEWSRQDAVLISWPTSDMDWRDYLSDIHAAYETIILTLLRFVDVVLITPSGSELGGRFLSEARSAKNTLYRVEGIELNDTWIRDYGPLCLLGETGEKQALDLRFNGWGLKFASDRDNQFARLFFQKGYFREEVSYEDGQSLVFEGGGIEVNSRGGGMSTLPLFTYPNRNAGFSGTIMDRVAGTFGLSSLDALDLTPLPGDDTDGHVDTMVRYISDDVVLSCVELPEEGKERLHAEVHRLPMPNPVIWEGEEKPATYANFLITNGAVLVPTYGDPEHDEEALRVIRKHAGEREVVGVDCRALVRQNGSLHCATMQIPEGFLDKTKLSKA